MQTKTKLINVKGFFSRYCPSIPHTHQTSLLGNGYMAHHPVFGQVIIITTGPDKGEWQQLSENAWNEYQGLSPESQMEQKPGKYTSSQPFCKFVTRADWEAFLQVTEAKVHCLPNASSALIRVEIKLSETVTMNLECVAEKQGQGIRNGKLYSYYEAGRFDAWDYVQTPKDYHSPRVTLHGEGSRSDAIRTQASEILSLL